MATLKELLFKYTTDTSRFIHIDGQLVHYRDEGKGEVIVLIHGAFSSLHTFNAWAKILKQKYRVIRLDLMGFGLTGPNDSGDYSMPNHVRFLLTFLNKMGIENCTLVGNSLGGWLSWEFTWQYPEMVKQLVLIDAAGFLDEGNIPLPFKLARAPIFGRVIKYVVRKPILEQFVKQVYYDSSKVTPQLVTRYYDLFTREGNTEAFLSLVNAESENNTRHLQDIQQRTLILWGQKDIWIPLNNAFRFSHLLPNAQLKIYPNVGHVPMEEAPELTMKDLLVFLEGGDVNASQLLPPSEVDKIKGRDINS